MAAEDNIHFGYVGAPLPDTYRELPIEDGNDEDEPITDDVLAILGFDPDEYDETDEVMNSVEIGYVEDGWEEVPRAPAGTTEGGQWTSGSSSIQKLLNGNYANEKEFRDAYQKTIVNEGKDRPVGENKTGGGDRGSGGSDSEVSQQEKERLQETVDGYLKKYGERFGLTERVPTNVILDENRSRAISEAYDNLPVDDSVNPKVKSAYDQLIKEVDAQYLYLTKDLGMKIVFTEGDPYKTSRDMVIDVVKKHQLIVYSGGEDHPLLGKVTMDENGITANEKFRAVHDYFGHSIEQNQFGKLGEERAWVAHSKMFSSLAQSALTTETRGQNSWVNFSGVNKDALEKIAEGNRLIKAGKIDAGRQLVAQGQQEFKFAVQKVGLLPSQYYDWRVYAKPGKVKNKGWEDVPRAPKGTGEGGQWIGTAATTEKTAGEEMAKFASNIPDGDPVFEAVEAYSNYAYSDMNKDLRKDLPMSDGYDKFKNEIDKFLKQAPKFSGKTYRGLSLTQDQYETFKSQIKQGGFLIDKGYVSTTLDVEQAGRFTTGTDFESMIEIEGKGVYLDGFSKNPHEREVLYARGTKFKIMAYKEIGRHLSVKLKAI